MPIDLKKLQNGSDIRGIAIQTENEQINLSPEIASLIGYSFIQWLLNKQNINNKKLKISVGMDSRITGPILKSAVISGIISAGAEAFDCGLASTPAMYMSTIIEEFRCDGAVMITASHLPYNRNGFKFFTNTGGLEKNDVSTILAIASSLNISFQETTVNLQKIPLMQKYSEIFIDLIRTQIASKDSFQQPLYGMKIAVDAGNGAGGFFVENVLKPLGADTSGSQYLEPDGYFPNHEPNPENLKAMESIRSAVLSSSSDLGIIFDTDVDRAAIVDSSGVIINRNMLIALISSIVLEEHPGTTIVTDSVTSDGLTSFIENTLNGKHHRFMRGYKNVIDEAKRLNESGIETHLAIETSGHAAIKENYFLDDGAYLMAKIIIKASRLKNNSEKSLISLIKMMKQPVEETEFRIGLLNKNFAEQGNLIIKELKKFILTQDVWIPAERNYEGFRVSCMNPDEKGWFLLRLSLHDPVLPLNIESEVIGGVRNITLKLIEFFKTFKSIDIKNILTAVSD